MAKKKKEKKEKKNLLSVWPIEISHPRGHGVV
jgi:hypothetical protein